MSDKSWKAWERRLASWFPNAARRGAYTGNGRQGKPDLICPGWSIECKLLARAGYQDLLDAAKQAEDNRERTDDIPVAVVKRKGDLDKDALVVMRLEVFAEFFVNQAEP